MTVSRPLYPNLALGRPALQSSVSPWSKFQDPALDAACANNGIADGALGFHTQTEPFPWWQVDLQSLCGLVEMTLVNRLTLASRLQKFTVLVSIDGTGWLPVYSKTDSVIFGDAEPVPYRIAFPENCAGRFVRIRLDGTGCLHFSECQIFGHQVEQAQCQDISDHFAAALQQYESTVGARQSRLLAGRRGHMVDIDGFKIFCDTDKYSRTMVEVLTSGGYEARERGLVNSLLQQNDRVLEIGTAIGSVTMVAASIVGAASVRTFDANPHVSADAQRNFDFNGLAEISAHVGVLQNRERFGGRSQDVPFHVARDFWASRLFVGSNQSDIVDVVMVPTACLEDQIADHRANVLVCDIEGGEVDLLVGADLSGIRLIIMEIHTWAVSEAANGDMIRGLLAQGFNVDFHASGQGIAVLRR